MRNYKRKYNVDGIPEAMEAAAEAVVTSGLSIRQSASNNGVNYKTLCWYIPIYKANNKSEGCSAGLYRSLPSADHSYGG